MTLENYIRKKLDTTFLVSFSLAGTLIVGQFPGFITQYLQRLGGYIDGKKGTSTDEIREAAKEFRGVDGVEEIAEKLTTAINTRIEARVTDLNEGLIAIREAKPLEKLTTFFKYADWEIIKGTLGKDYKSSININLETIAYCALGAALGVVTYKIVKGLCRRRKGFR